MRLFDHLCSMGACEKTTLDFDQGLHSRGVFTAEVLQQQKFHQLEGFSKEKFAALEQRIECKIEKLGSSENRHCHKATVNCFLKNHPH